MIKFWKRIFKEVTRDDLIDLSKYFIDVAKQKKDKELEYAMLKMRVIELEKKPAPVVSISTDNNWSKYAILGIGVVIFLIILRRRA